MVFFVSLRRFRILICLRKRGGQNREGEREREGESLLWGNRGELFLLRQKIVFAMLLPIDFLFFFGGALL